MSRLFVTGANGYIGRRLVEAARRAGLEVVAGVRGQQGVAGTVRFDCAILAIMVVLFVLFARLRRLDESMTHEVRHLAIQEAAIQEAAFREDLEPEGEDPAETPTHPETGQATSIGRT